MPAAKHTSDEWTKAIELYRALGPTEASKLTGIDAGNIVRKAKTLGVTTIVTTATRASVEQHMANASLKHAENLEGLVGLIAYGIALAQGTHDIFVGQAGARRSVKGLLPEEYRAVASGIAALDKQVGLRLGQATERTDSTVKVADVSIPDEYWDIFEQAIDAEAARRAGARRVGP